MYVGALHRQLLGTFIIGLLSLLAGCSTEPPAVAITTTALPMPTNTQVSNPSPAPSPSSSAIPTPTSVAPPVATTPVTQTALLTPLTPLRNTTIVERLAADMRPLTNGKIKYKVAAWSPGSEWIAVTPQDGPGLDVVNARTGELRAVVTDTYVLEPAWLDQTTLVVHRIGSAGDQLVGFPIDSPSDEPAVLVSVPGQLHAVSAAGGTVTYGTPDNQLEMSVIGPPPVKWTTLLNPLITAPMLSRDNPRMVAVTPYVTDLEQVQTVLVQPTADGFVSLPLSKVGEGLWLPRWAPDAEKLALTSIGGRIVTTTVNGQQRFELGPGDSPAWSPDGTRIAFAGTSAGEEFVSRDIYVLDWQGATPRVRLTKANDEQFYTSPTWSPDGTRLAFIEIDTGQLFVVDAPPR